MRVTSPRILATIRGYARDDDQANDLLQDCWVHILKRLDGFTWNGSFAAWAIAVSKNVCKMRLRREKRANVSEVALEDIGEVASGGPDPADELELRRQRRAVHSALGRLPDRERDVILLRLLEGRGTAETARVLEISNAGVRSIFARGMSRLRRMEEVRELLLEWMRSG